MGDSSNKDQYDQALVSILENEKSILGFLSTIFSFLARRTDFYYVPKDPNENMGFPPGVAEELVVKVLRKCDPKTWKLSDSKADDINDEIMCSTVAQEVEIVDESSSHSIPTSTTDMCQHSSQDEDKKDSIKSDKSNLPKNYKTPPVKPAGRFDNIPVGPPAIIPLQNSESYNGAVREKYTWSQSIMDLDIIIKLPSHVKSSKDLKVKIQSADICVATRSGEIIINDSFPFKIKAFESVWSLSEGRLLIHLEKGQERWWNKLLNGEEELDLDKLDCSRPLAELPEDHIEKVRELTWNQDQKRKGLPTSDDIRNIEVLKKAWNSPGSPFQGKEFDPSVVYKQ
ncbi:nudC domain-containing protein 3 isoform X1 [Leptidea sinapis]|uniref:nudC domain-containing protein 3 isoform X1 n=2 Tax=Leptidea sinapis TaxID=189913 RepID=UPI0021430355|nr:nudC domain-containing protein 3 isoform X1 [Leptidea sinapis]